MRPLTSLLNVPNVPPPKTTRPRGAGVQLRVLEGLYDPLISSMDGVASATSTTSVFTGRTQ